MLDFLNAPAKVSEPILAAEPSPAPRPARPRKAMNSAVILEGSPTVANYYRKSPDLLMAETGGNTGNLAFRYAIASHLPNAASLHWDAPIEDIRAAGDVIVLPLANQLGAHMDLGKEAERLRTIGMPVLGIGLGAQAATIGEDIAIRPGTRDWLAAIATSPPDDHPNIGVRGAYSRAQIAKLGWPEAPVITGCPSNFINMADDIAGMVAAGMKRPIRSVAVAAGIQYIPALARIERDLAEVVTRTNGVYIMQHDLDMVRLARRDYAAVDPKIFALCKDYIRPGTTDDGFRDWLRQYAYAFADVPAWMDFLRRFDFVVGTRLHGVMLAIQAGVPAGCIAHDSRTMEMCRTMDIPVCDHRDITGSITANNVLDYFSFDPDRYRETRRRLCRHYVAMLRAARLPLHPGLDSLQNLRAG